MDAAAAQAFVQALTRAVEDRALPPRDPAEYAEARRRLDATATPIARRRVDRRRLYRDARALLATLDTDGHTILWSEAQTRAWYAVTSPDRAETTTVASHVAVDGREIRHVVVLLAGVRAFLGRPARHRHDQHLGLSGLLIAATVRPSHRSTHRFLVDVQAYVKLGALFHGRTACC